MSNRTNHVHIFKSQQDTFGFKAEGPLQKPTLPQFYTDILELSQLFPMGFFMFVNCRVQQAAHMVFVSPSPKCNVCSEAASTMSD